MFELRPYQTECLTAINTHFDDGIRKQLIALPTGTGKTIIFASLIRERKKLRSIILSHRDEICQQANEKMLMVYPEAEADIGWVKAERNEVDKPIVIASVQTICRPNRLDQLGHFDLIITDEAHHAVAPTYQRIYETLVDENLHCGFTATPNRADKKGLGKVYEKVVFEKTIKEMIGAGWLCKLEGKRIFTDISLDSVHKVAGDFNKSELTAVINTTNRNKLIAESWLEHASDRKTLAFTVDIRHAHDLSQTFRDYGVRASPISGQTPHEERHELEHQFHTGEIQVLCNCYLLTEGYDEPAIDCILLARPTQSQSFYIQMVGRGTRPLPEKKDCLILDVVDNTTKHSIRQFADLGLEPEPKKEGKFASAPTAEGERERFKDYGVGDKLYSEEVDLLGKTAQFDWTRLDCDTFNLSLGNGYLKVGLRKDGNGYYAYFKPLNEDLQFITPRHKVSLSWAIGIAEGFARRHLKGNYSLIEKDASWKSDPPSAKQINLMTSFGLEIPHGLTKGEARDLISKFFHSEKQKKRWR